MLVAKEDEQSFHLDDKSALEDEKKVQNLWQQIISLPSLSSQVAQTERFLIDSVLFQYTVAGSFLNHFRGKTFWGRKLTVEKEAKKMSHVITSHFQAHFNKDWAWSKQVPEETFDYLILGNTLQQHYPAQFSNFWLSIRNPSDAKNWTSKRIQTAIRCALLDPKELRLKYDSVLFDLTVKSNLRWIRREGPRFLFMEWFRDEWQNKKFTYYLLAPLTEAAKKRTSPPLFMRQLPSYWTFTCDNDQFVCSYSFQDVGDFFLNMGIKNPISLRPQLRYHPTRREFDLVIRKDGFELCLSNQPDTFTFPHDIVQQYLLFCRCFCHQLQLRYRFLDFPCLWNIIEMAFPQIHKLFLHFPDRRKGNLTN